MMVWFVWTTLEGLKPEDPQKRLLELHPEVAAAFFISKKQTLTPLIDLGQARL
jgi:hypothetical protein